MMARRKLPPVSIGNVYGRLTVMAPAEPLKSETGANLPRWLCRCRCGKELVVRASRIKGGYTLSCGCARKKHGHDLATSKAYRAWTGMRQRCNNPGSGSYYAYGGKGIQVCSRWDAPNNGGFQNFLEDMGEPPTAHHSVDRVDPTKDYCPENCRWLPMREQSGNRTSCVMLEHRGKRMNVTDWARVTGISSGALHSRLRRGWSVADTLDTPAQKRKASTDE